MSVLLSDICGAAVGPSDQGVFVSLETDVGRRRLSPTLASTFGMAPAPVDLSFGPPGREVPIGSALDRRSVAARFDLRESGVGSFHGASVMTSMKASQPFQAERLKVLYRHLVNAAGRTDGVPGLGIAVSLGEIVLARFGTASPGSRIERLVEGFTSGRIVAWVDEGAFPFSCPYLGLQLRDEVPRDLVGCFEREDAAASAARECFDAEGLWDRLVAAGCDPRSMAIQGYLRPTDLVFSAAGFDTSKPCVLNVKGLRLADRLEWVTVEGLHRLLDGGLARKAA